MLRNIYIPATIQAHIIDHRLINREKVNFILNPISWGGVESPPSLQTIANNHKYFCLGNKFHRGSHSQEGREWRSKKSAKMKVLIKEMIPPRISYQWVGGSRGDIFIDIDLIRITLTKRYIFLELV